jgi:hypothetical protein
MSEASLKLGMVCAAPAPGLVGASSQALWSFALMRLQPKPPTARQSENRSRLTLQPGNGAALLIGATE